MFCVREALREAPESSHLAHSSVVAVVSVRDVQLPLRGTPS